MASPRNELDFAFGAAHWTVRRIGESSMSIDLAELAAVAFSAARGVGGPS